MQCKDISEFKPLMYNNLSHSMLRPEFVSSLCMLSKGSEVYNYVVVDSVIRCTCYVYQHILHVPDMNVFTHSFYVTIQVYDLMRSEYVWSSCYTCTICNVHVCVHFVCKIKFVLCSEVRICLLTLLYISCTWVMILTCWCLIQFYSYTCTSVFCEWILLWLQHYCLLD